MTRLPTFIIAGSMRCGTTALNSYLRDHPDVAVSSNKEVHFFDEFFDEGVDWYRQHFAAAGNTLAVGEATPNYMFEPDAMERMRTVLPDVRLVVMLRNPVDRAYSHYWHDRARLKTSQEFEDYVRDELEGRPVPEPYVARGRYRGQIESILAQFDSDQLHVALFEELSDDPEPVYAAVCRHIGVDDEFVPEGIGAPVNSYIEFRSVRLRRLARKLPEPLRTAIGKVNTRSAATYPPIPRHVRHLLAQHYGEANDGLADLLGRPLPW